MGGGKNKERESRCYHRGGGGGGEQHRETGSQLSIAAQGARQTWEPVAGQIKASLL